MINHDNQKDKLISLHCLLFCIGQNIRKLLLFIHLLISHMAKQPLIKWSDFRETITFEDDYFISVKKKKQTIQNECLYVINTGLILYDRL